MKYLKIFQNLSSQGFSLSELLTVTAVVGVLSTVGISSYRTQQSKAQTAEAKYSLASLFSFEQEFKETWDTYHENLVIVGAIPIGPQNYDVGFVDDTLDSMAPDIPDDYAQEATCNNWGQMCDGTCATNVENNAGNPSPEAYLKSDYFSCTMNSPKLVKDSTTSGYEASSTAFKAMARGEIDSEDLWSIDQDQTVTRELNGEN